MNALHGGLQNTGKNLNASNTKMLSVQLWRNPGSHTRQNSRCTGHLSDKPCKSEEQDTWDTAEEVMTNSKAMFYHRFQDMDAPVLAGHWGRLTLVRLWRQSMLSKRPELYIYIYIYIYMKWRCLLLGYIIYFRLVSLCNAISTFVGYLLPKPSV